MYIGVHWCQWAFHVGSICRSKKLVKLPKPPMQSPSFYTVPPAMRGRQTRNLPYCYGGRRVEILYRTPRHAGEADTEPAVFLRGASCRSIGPTLGLPGAEPAVLLRGASQRTSGLTMSSHGPTCRDRLPPHLPTYGSTAGYQPFT